MLETCSIQATSGGVEVFLQSGPDAAEVEKLAALGRQIAQERARAAGHHVNVLASENGPFAVDSDTGRIPADSDELESFRKEGKLAYRKKFIFTFAGF